MKKIRNKAIPAWLAGYGTGQASHSKPFAKEMLPDCRQAYCPVYREEAIALLGIEGNLLIHG